MFLFDNSLILGLKGVATFETDFDRISSELLDVESVTADVTELSNKFEAIVEDLIRNELGQCQVSTFHVFLFTLSFIFAVLSYFLLGIQLSSILHVLIFTTTLTLGGSPCVSSASLFCWRFLSELRWESLACLLVLVWNDVDFIFLCRCRWLEISGDTEQFRMHLQSERLLRQPQTSAKVRHLGQGQSKLPLRGSLKKTTRDIAPMLLFLIRCACFCFDFLIVMQVLDY